MVDDVYINQSYIKKLCESKEISQNQLANLIGVSRGAWSNALSRKRGVGRKTLVGLLRVFPEETVSTLTEERKVS